LQTSGGFGSTPLQLLKPQQHGTPDKTSAKRRHADQSTGTDRAGTVTERHTGVPVLPVAVSTTFSKSAFVSIFSWTALPVPRMTDLVICDIK